MTALLRYQTALLIRSHRWLAPLLLHVAFLAVGVRVGEPVLGALGIAAAALVPTAAWLTRVCVTNEPPAARDCSAAAAGPGRTHLAAVLTALLASAALGTVCAALVAAVSAPTSADRAVAVPFWPALRAGVAAALACALLGVAVGALCNRPLLRSTARAVPATVLAVFLVLFAGVSPAMAAVQGLVTGSRDGSVHVPLLPLAAAAVLTAGATAVACAASGRRG
ncbi:ABC transporter [Streptomyces triculaminicus]|uniref:ABC transporter n=1 Tax=Streptomyces triculaminicus TaxID=2816232 RepID=UPI0033C1EEC6